MFVSQTSGHLEKSALIFLYNIHREHNLLKSIVKKLSPKINVKNIKNRVFFFFFFSKDSTLSEWFILGLILLPYTVIIFVEKFATFLYSGGSF